MINAINIFVFGIMFCLLIPLHEYIHYRTLKKLGYTGKLVFVKKVLGIGIKPIGVKDNFIGAYDMITFLIAPLPITFLWNYSAFAVLSNSALTSIIFGCIITLIGCSQDIFYCIQLRNIWCKSKRFLNK